MTASSVDVSFDVDADANAKTNVDVDADDDVEADDDYRDVADNRKRDNGNGCGDDGDTDDDAQEFPELLGAPTMAASQTGPANSATDPNQGQRPRAERNTAELSLYGATCTTELRIQPQRWNL